MYIRPLLATLGLLATAPLYADAYTWTDENGIIHYSDKPNPGAKVIVLPESGPTRPRQPLSARSTNEPDESGIFEYESVAVSRPAAEETLWNIEGRLEVAVAVSPPLRRGHRVRVFFDGSPQLTDDTSFQLQEVWRGVHNLQVEVIDEAGNLMIRSQPTRFYVQQNSIIQAR